MKPSLIKGDVEKTLIRLAGPMVLGMLGLIIFNLVDTYFVSKLGTNQLAALSFTFPIVLVVNSIALGIGQGTASVVSRAAGSGDHDRLTRYATDSLTLGVMVVLIFVLIGLATIEPLFKALGATDLVMPYIKDYMSIWYLGVLFVVIPMVGNNSIRALGDTRTPSFVMLLAAIANSILDPIFIFGWGFIPAMGVRGAAIATVLSRCITFSVALYILIVREKIVSLKPVSLSARVQSWKDILYIGIPNALTKIIQPFGIAVITRLLASEGLFAVAGYGVASKVERFALIFIMALAIVMTPFAGQNYGAGHLDRVKKGVRSSIKISLISSVVVYAVLIIFGRSIGQIYSTNDQVVDVLVLYLQIVPIVYGVQGIMLIVISVLNAVNKPIEAALISVTQMFIIYIPLAFVGRNVFGISGIFGALGASYIIASVLGLHVLNNWIKTEEVG